MENMKLLIEELDQAIETSGTLPYTEDDVKDAFQDRLDSVGVDNISIDDVTIDVDGTVIVSMQDAEGGKLTIAFGTAEDDTPIGFKASADDQTQDDFTELDLSSLNPPLIDSSLGSFIDLSNIDWITNEILAQILGVDPSSLSSSDTEDGEAPEDNDRDDDKDDDKDKDSEEDEPSPQDDQEGSKGDKKGDKKDSSKEPFDLKGFLGNESLDVQEVRRMGQTVKALGRRGRVTGLKWAVRKGKRVRRPVIRWVGRLKPAFKIARKRAARKAHRKLSASLRKRRISVKRGKGFGFYRHR